MNTESHSNENAETAEQVASSAQNSQKSASEFSEDAALALLGRPDVPAEALALISRNPAVIKSRKVALAITMHRRTPRHVSIPLLRRMFTFDLMRVSLTPAVAADIKRVAEEQILIRLESLSAGERISLARRASGRVAAALLGDPDPRILSTALDNSHLVENAVVAALMKHDAPGSLFVAVSGHPKWPQRREVQIALLRSVKTPWEHAREFAKHFSKESLLEIVPENRKSVLISGLGETGSE